jgi:hypothetical protein
VRQRCETSMVADPRGGVASSRHQRSRTSQFFTGRFIPCKFMYTQHATASRQGPLRGRPPIEPNVSSEIPTGHATRKPGRQASTPQGGPLPSSAHHRGCPSSAFGAATDHACSPWLHHPPESSNLVRNVLRGGPMRSRRAARPGWVPASSPCRWGRK